MSNYNPLTLKQLELVAHVANGVRVSDIAKHMHLSESSVQSTLDTARKRANAKTLAHLVSIVIANGMLQWNEESNYREINN